MIVCIAILAYVLLAGIGGGGTMALFLVFHASFL